MQVSTRFLSLLHFQLAQFVDSDELRSVVVYVTQPGEEEAPSLVPIGQWPSDGRALPNVEVSSPLRQPAAQRRWLPLRHQEVLLGAIQVESDTVPWPEALSQRLQAVALCLTEALCLDLEQQRLAQNLRLQDEQLDVLVHQLRNPLAALRTFGQLLLRRLEQDNQNRPLVEGLLAEERQLNRYVDAIGQLGSQDSLPSPEGGAQPLLLPPVLSGPAGTPARSSSRDTATPSSVASFSRNAAVSTARLALRSGTERKRGSCASSGSPSTVIALRNCASLPMPR